MWRNFVNVGRAVFIQKIWFFFVLFFGRAAWEAFGAKLLPKTHVSLHASHSAVPKEQFKNFCTNVALSTLSKFLRNSAQLTQCSVYFLFCIPQQSVTHPISVFTSQLFTLPPSHIYWRGEKSLPGNLQSGKCSFSTLTVIMILAPLTTQHISSFL